jgi:hypothetical protein
MMGFLELGLSEGRQMEWRAGGTPYGVRRRRKSAVGNVVQVLMAAVL